MDTCFIQTKASLNRKKPELKYSATCFEAYKPKPKSKPIIDETIDEPEEIKPTKKFSFKEAPEINIKRAKQEIIKFGMTGFDTATQEEAKVKLAIKLGAKPKKNKHKNYKLLLEEKKKEKLAKEAEAKFQQLGKNNAGRSTAKGKSFDKKRKLKSDLLDIYGTVKAKDLKSVQKHKNFGKIKKI